jgi:hypothetical protein
MSAARPGTPPPTVSAPPAAAAAPQQQQVSSASAGPASPPPLPPSAQPWPSAGADQGAAAPAGGALQQAPRQRRRCAEVCNDLLVAEAASLFTQRQYGPAAPAALEAVGFRVGRQLAERCGFGGFRRGAGLALLLAGLAREPSSRVRDSHPPVHLCLWRFPSRHCRA